MAKEFKKGNRMFRYISLCYSTCHVASGCFATWYRDVVVGSFRYTHGMDAARIIPYAIILVQKLNHGIFRRNL
jgi:hypothetical protein